MPLDVWDIDIPPSQGKFTRWPGSLDSGQEHAICQHAGMCRKPESWTLASHLVCSRHEHPHGSSTVSGAVGGQRLACHLVPWVTRRRIVALCTSGFQVRVGSTTHIMAWVRLAVMFEVFFFYKTFLTKLVKGRFDGQECRLCRECQNLFVILSFVTTKPKIMLSWNRDLKKMT